jgi:uncharacterized protein
MLLRSFIFLAIIFIVDWYFFQAIKTLTAKHKDFILIQRIYWGVTIVLLSISLFYFLNIQSSEHQFFRIYFGSFIFILLISKIIAIPFLLVDDISRMFQWVYKTVMNIGKTPSEVGAVVITRAEFLSRIAIIAAAIPFLSFIWGMVKGAFDYTVRKEKIFLANLPASFNGLKILQISDIHIGSFVNTNPLEEAVKIINEQDADLVFFTGDLVNNLAKETDGFTETLKKIKAKKGVYSILGNHDYGDYVQWENEELKKSNLAKLKAAHKEMGWKLLLNENHILENETEKIAILGVENWSASLRFPKYGKLEQAVKGTEDVPVKLLLSHDPSHWDAMITTDYKNIDVTFSGHTHGMQFGIEIPGFKWSPVQYVYKQWAGLYQKENQYLYVNRGLGFIGYPGRVGILPEISVFELTNVKA